MITIFNRECVYKGYSVQEYQRVMGVLRQNGIKFVNKWKEFHPVSHKMGRFGQLSQYDFMYELYVHKDDFEKCRYLLRKKQ